MTAKASTALLTAVWGVLGSLLGPRTAGALVGVLLLTTPLLLPRRAAPLAPEPEPELKSELELEPGQAPNRD